MTKLSIFWLKFQGDPEIDEYRYQQSTYFDKTVPTLWSAIEVAELTGKTAQKAPPRDPERKPGKGGTGKGGKGGTGKIREKKNQPGCSRMASASMAKTASSNMRTVRARGHLSGRCCSLSWWTAR